MFPFSVSSFMLTVRTALVMLMELFPVTENLPGNGCISFISLFDGENRKSFSAGSEHLTVPCLL
jgi:hypothetical protein